MIKKISNFPIEKLILWNSFFRNLATSFASIYISTIFILEVGQENWPQIFQYVQIFGLIFIFLTNFLRRHQYYLFHKGMILISLICLALLTSSPRNVGFITAVAVMTFAADLIGEITATNIIASTMSSLSYKATSPKIVAYATSANILASLLVIAVQSYGDVYIFVAMVVLALLIHLSLFHLMTKKPKLHHKQKDSFYVAEENFVERIKETISYGLKNPLVLLIFALFIWSQVAKFIADWLYLSCASSIFTKKENLSIFLSVTNIILMSSMFIFQKIWVKKFLARFTPATIIGIIPIMFLILSSLGILFKYPAIGIAVNILFIFTLKTVHMPTLQISLQSLDPKIKSKVILLMNFCISLALIIITTTMRALKGHFNLEYLYISLIFTGILGLIFMIQFEGPYFRNLWEGFIEKEDNSFSSVTQFADENATDEKEVKSTFFNPHHFFTDHHSKKISGEVADYLQILTDFPLDDSTREFIEYFYHSSRTPFERLLLILNAYAYSKNIKVFKEAVTAHKFLLHSTDNDREKAHQLMALLETTEFKQLLQNLEASTNEHQAIFAKKINLISENLDEAMLERSTVHLRIKIFGLINWEYLTANNQKTLLEILKSPYSSELGQLSCLLSDPDIRVVKHDLLRSWQTKLARIDLVEFVRRYLSSGSIKRKVMQKILMSVLPNPQDAETVKKMVGQHAEEKHQHLSQNELLEMLFLREWLSLKDLSFSYVLESIGQYEHLGPEERKYWKDFHLEFLKKVHSVWFTSLVREEL